MEPLSAIKGRLAFGSVRTDKLKNEHQLARPDNEAPFSAEAGTPRQMALYSNHLVRGNQQAACRASCPQNAISRCFQAVPNLNSVLGALYQPDYCPGIREAAVSLVGLLPKKRLNSRLNCERLA